VQRRSIFWDLSSSQSGTAGSGNGAQIRVGFRRRYISFCETPKGINLDQILFAFLYHSLCHSDPSLRSGLKKSLSAIISGSLRRPLLFSLFHKPIRTMAAA
jgi:hypothetical protein